jgi:hypothetical protein
MPSVPTQPYLVRSIEEIIFRVVELAHDRNDMSQMWPYRTARIALALLVEGYEKTLQTALAKCEA